MVNEAFAGVYIWLCWSMQIEYFALFKEHLKDEKLFVSQNKIEMCHLIHIVAGRVTYPPLSPYVRLFVG